jgi:hypothetical protein
VLHRERTDGDGRNLDAILNVGVRSIVGILVLQNTLAAKSVDEGSTACESQSKSVSQ